MAQFLNKRTGSFNEDDRVQAANVCTTLALRVHDFISNPRALIEMGYTPRTNSLSVSLMFIDLSNYSRLFAEMDSSIITELLNEFFQQMCAIVFSHGAVGDQFLGDGAFFVFNVDQNMAQHQRSAVKAGFEMREAFRKLREGWVTRGYRGTEHVFVRIGLSCGRVTRAELGPTQARRITMIGPAVNAAATACDSGPRNRDCVCVSREFLQEIPDENLRTIQTATASGSAFMEVDRGDQLVAAKSFRT